MSGKHVLAEPLTPEAFRPFGDVIEAVGEPDVVINDGRCGRFHDRARLFFGEGRAGISIFRSSASPLPYTLTLMERHPVGSQAFIPMTAAPFLVVVADDGGGLPTLPRAFVTRPYQGVNYLRNIWHAPLIALEEDALFTVVDRIGGRDNLEECRLTAAITISAPSGL